MQTAITDTALKIIQDHTRALNRYVDYERTKKRKETWVKARQVAQLTGWKKEAMRSARIAGTVVFKKEGGHCLYLIESIPKQLLINRTEYETERSNERDGRVDSVGPLSETEKIKS